MSLESNKKTVNRMPLEAFNEGRLEVVDEVMSADMVDHGSQPGLPPGRERGSGEHVRLSGRACEPTAAAPAADRHDPGQRGGLEVVGSRVTPLT